VLGIDNIVFISILVDKLPKEKRALARRIGLFMAMFMRIGLLLVCRGSSGWLSRSLPCPSRKYRDAT
jgi:hypothetical protein